MTITSIQSTERAQVIAPAAAPQVASSATTSPQDNASGYYFSPVLKLDPATQSVVIQYRNTQTGAVTNQYPSEKELKAYASQQKFADLESEPGATKPAASTDTASQPAATATVDASAVKPASTFNTSTTVPPKATPAVTVPPQAKDSSGSSIVI